MKPYIFNYSDSVQMKTAGPRDLPGVEHRARGVPALDSTVVTFTVEPIDPDGSAVSTIVTRSVEPADADEFLSASTYVTESTEPADPDMIELDSTVVTKSIEPGDEDYIHPLFRFPRH